MYGVSNSAWHPVNCPPSVQLADDYLTDQKPKKAEPFCSFLYLQHPGPGTDWGLLVNLCERPGNRVLGTGGTDKVLSPQFIAVSPGPSSNVHSCQMPSRTPKLGKELSQSPVSPALPSGGVGSPRGGV